MDKVDFKQNAQCNLSFYSWGELELETSFKDNDFDIKHTDFVKIDKSAVENLKAFVDLGGKLTGFDKNKMKFTWNVDFNKTTDEWLLFGGNKVESRFINICKILKCFNLKDEKFGLETCLKDNKFFGLDLKEVESLLERDTKGTVRELILNLFDGLKTLDDYVGVKYYSQLAGCEVLDFDKDRGLGNNDVLVINLVEPTNTK